MSERAVGVSFVVPVHNGARWLDAALAAILAQDDGPFEVLAVDDGSTDRSPEILRAYAVTGRVRVLAGEGRGAAAAINLGVSHARHPIICQIDQDVVLEPGWLVRVTEALGAPDVAAVQGHYVVAPGAGPWPRVMGLDLRQRYGRIRSASIDHVCTGNAAYRAAALARVGPFDESLGYGYDNDMSYRLVAAGFRLVFARTATSVHHWGEGARAYHAQQYGQGYGRLDGIARHRRRLGGDDVSGPGMILHVPIMLGAIGSLAGAAVLAVAGGPATGFLMSAGILGGALALERFVAGLGAAVRFREPAGLWFAPVHLLRDLAWALATMVWIGRRLRRRPSRPSHSMLRAPRWTPPPRSSS
jgi:hypothetical protein